jgi:hypothetical protein
MCSVWGGYRVVLCWREYIYCGTTTSRVRITELLEHSKAKSQERRGLSHIKSCREVPFQMKTFCIAFCESFHSMRSSYKIARICSWQNWISFWVLSYGMDWSATDFLWITYRQFHWTCSLLTLKFYFFDSVVQRTFLLGNLSNNLLIGSIYYLISKSLNWKASVFPKLIL